MALDCDIVVYLLCYYVVYSMLNIVSDCGIDNLDELDLDPDVPPIPKMQIFSHPLAAASGGSISTLPRQIEGRTDSFVSIVLKADECSLVCSTDCTTQKLLKLI